jgi:hypothetical protein
VIVYGSLFIKNWQTYHVFKDTGDFKESNVKDVGSWWVFLRIGIVLLFEIVYLIVWMALDRPHVVLFETAKTTSEMCTLSPLRLPIQITEILFLVSQTFLLYLVRNLEKRYNEFYYLAFTIYNATMMKVLISIFQTFLNQPAGHLLMDIMETLLIIQVPVWLYFIPKIILIAEKKQEALEKKLSK